MVRNRHIHGLQSTLKIPRDVCVGAESMFVVGCVKGKKPQAQNDVTCAKLMIPKLGVKTDLTAVLTFTRNVILIN